MKIGTKVCMHILCDTNAERDDVIALLELYDYKQIMTLFDFDVAPAICIYRDEMEYQTVSGYSSIPDWNASATDFINANF